MTSAEKIKYVRGTLLISQKDLAKELGVSNVTMNRWEKGSGKSIIFNGEEI